MEFRNPVLSHIALEEHVRQGGAESGTGKMWEGLPSSDLRILTLAKNPANIVGGNFVVNMKPDMVMILFES